MQEEKPENKVNGTAEQDEEVETAEKLQETPESPPDKPPDEKKESEEDKEKDKDGSDTEDKPVENNLYEEPKETAATSPTAAATAPAPAVRTSVLSSPPSAASPPASAASPPASAASPPASAASPPPSADSPKEVTADAVSNHTDSEVSDELSEDEVEEAVYSNTPSNKPVTAPPPHTLYSVQATHKYTREDVDELSFEPGEIIYVIEFENAEEQDDGWQMGIKQSDGIKGVFPENFTQKI